MHLEKACGFCNVIGESGWELAILENLGKQNYMASDLAIGKNEHNVRQKFSLKSDKLEF